MSQYPNGGTPPSTITEDSPQWNCSTMGNHVCGTQQPLADTGPGPWVGDMAGIGAVGLFVGLVLCGYKRFRKGGFANLKGH